MDSSTLTSKGKVHQVELLKAEIRAAGWTLSALAQELGVSRQMVTRVLRGYDRSARVEAFIAKKLGKSLDEVFPHWYKKEQDDGKGMV